MDKRPPRPPALAERFLQWFCSEEVIETLYGDLYELYQRRVRQLGKRKADLYFFLEVLDVCRPFAWKSKSDFQKNHIDMLRYNFKIAWRILLKEKMHSLIKIGGFALGIAACLLICLYIGDEFSYDLHYENADRTYRVIWVSNEDGKIEKDVFFSAPFARTLKQEFAEVQLAGRFLESELFGAGNKEIRRADQKQSHFETGFIYADQELLEILDIPIVKGDPRSALSEPRTVVISQSMADKYFPEEDAIGQTVILDNKQGEAFKISGIMADFPTNSHIRYNFLITLSEVEFWPGEQRFWAATNYPTYVRLHPDTNVKELEQKLMEISHKYRVPNMKKYGIAEADEILTKVSFELQPIRDIHLHSADIDDDLTHGDIRIVWLFGTIAVFILIIACINFINLSTAKSAIRAKEVGLRKVVGSYKRQLVQQFLTESVVYSMLSFLIGVLIAGMLLPYFNQLSGKALAFPWTHPQLWLVLLGASLLMGVIAGLYPAFYLSAFQPIQALKDQTNRISNTTNIQSALVVVQFTISIALIIGTYIVHEQMGYIFNKKLGFEKEQVVILNSTHTLGDKIGTFKKELLTLPEVSAATVSGSLPVRGTIRNYNQIWKEGGKEEGGSVSAQIWKVDHDYVKALGLNIVAGRDFNVDLPTDSQAMIINQTLAKELGLIDAVGQRVANHEDVKQIIGVVDDFHFESMKEEIVGLGLIIGNESALMSVKVNSQDMAGFIQHATGIWKNFAPHQSLRYSFLDESFAAMYEDVQTTKHIVRNFAILAVIVACLGLYALSSFTTEQRRKEIGIRKILGASVNSIFRLLTQRFLVLVSLAILIAGPVSWYVMQKWLQDFEYRIDIGWRVFALSGLLSIFITLLTVGFQTLRAATDNPVKALGRE